MGAMMHGHIESWTRNYHYQLRDELSEQSMGKREPLPTSTAHVVFVAILASARTLHVVHKPISMFKEFLGRTETVDGAGSIKICVTIFPTVFPSLLEER